MQHASWFIYYIYYLIVSMKSYCKGCVHSLHSRCFVISGMQEHGIHGNNWTDLSLSNPFAAKSAYQNTKQIWTFLFNLEKNIVKYMGSIKRNGSLLNRTLLSFLETSSEFMVFKVKLWSLWESFKMLFNSAVFLSSCE